MKFSSRKKGTRDPVEYNKQHRSWNAEDSDRINVGFGRSVRIRYGVPLTCRLRDEAGNDYRTVLRRQPRLVRFQSVDVAQLLVVLKPTSLLLGERAKEGELHRFSVRQVRDSAEYNGIMIIVSEVSIFPPCCCFSRLRPVWENWAYKLTIIYMVLRNTVVVIRKYCLPR